MGTEKRARQRANRQARLEAALAAQRRAQRKKKYVRYGIVAVAVIAILAGFAFWPRSDGKTVQTGDTSPSTASSTTATTAAGAPAAFTYGSGPCPPASGAPPTKTFGAAPMLCIDPAKAYTAIFDTSAGTVKATLDTTRTPGTTNNFVTLARYGYYDGTKFFRTNTAIAIIQGGGNTNTDSPGYTIPDEGGKFTYSPGDLVMARTSQPNSAGGQFFFAVNDNTKSLDAQGTYVTFGKVTEGLDVLAKVLASNAPASSAQPDEGAPNPPVTVNSIRIEETLR
jgi:peptidyl-prolyl cis-trans isomerase B (cyclophilin B)